MRMSRLAKLAFALTGATAMLAQGTAYASTVTVTLSDPTHSAYSNVTVDSFTGSQIPTDGTTVLPLGWHVAENGAAGAPVNGDTVATGNATARWQPFCLHSTMSLTGKWVSPIESGAPAGTVGEVKVTSTLFTTTVWITKSNTGQYSLYVPTMPSAFVCSSTTDAETVMTVLGTVSGTTRHPTQNPDTPGTYTATSTWHDTAGVTHTDSASVPVT